MNQVVITIKNYRCFPDSKPARFTLKDGLTSLVLVPSSETQKGIFEAS